MVWKSSGTARGGNNVDTTSVQQKVDNDSNAMVFDLSISDTGVCGNECVPRLGEHEIQVSSEAQSHQENKHGITKLHEYSGVKVDDTGLSHLQCSGSLNSVNVGSPMNANGGNNVASQPCVVQGNNYPGVEEKFVNSIMHANQLTVCTLIHQSITLGVVSLSSCLDTFLCLSKQCRQ